MRNLAVASVLIAGILIAAGASFAAPKAKASSKKKIPGTILVENRRSAELTNLSIYAAGADDKALSSIRKPLPAGKKIALSLKGLKACMVTISGTFSDESDASGEVDVCAEKSIRLVD